MTTNPQGVAKDERQVIHNISDFGWHTVNVIEDDGHPPWTYSIGFYETWGFPELIVIDRSRATAHHILGTIALKLDVGDRPDLNATTNTLIPGARVTSSKPPSVTIPTTSASPAGSTASAISPSTKLSGPTPTASTPGVSTLPIRLKTGNMS
jgi:hypothetical protein